MFSYMVKNECKQFIKSITCLCCIGLLFIFVYMQMPFSEMISKSTKPEEGKSYYGVVYSKNENDIMERTFARLVEETASKTYATYTFGIYKEITLSDNDRNIIINYIEQATNVEFEELVRQKEEYFVSLNMSKEATYEEIESAQCGYVVKPIDTYTYEKFQETMTEVAKIIGSGSMYEKDQYSTVQVLASYEDALAEYEDLANYDGGTNALMRLFCDYASIILMFVPIFILAIRWRKDEIDGVASVIHSKKASSAAIVISRYVACVGILFISLILLAGFVEIDYIFSARGSDLPFDYLAFVKYTCVWLLPQIMIISSIACMLSECLGYLFAIIIQIILGVVCVLSNGSLIGDFGYRLLIRWNTFGGHSDFIKESKAYYINRGIYFVLAIVILVITVVCYEMHRSRGRRLGVVKRHEESITD